MQAQIYLGSDTFVKKMQDEVDKKPAFTEIPRAQRRALARALSDYAKAHERDEAIAWAICPANIRWQRLPTISASITRR